MNWNKRRIIATIAGFIGTLYLDIFGVTMTGVMLVLGSIGYIIWTIIAQDMERD